MTKRLITMAEICDLYQVTRFTVRRWYKAGILPPPLRLGRSLRWLPDQVEAALQTPVGANVAPAGRP